MRLPSPLIPLLPILVPFVPVALGGCGGPDADAPGGAGTTQGDAAAPAATVTLELHEQESGTEALLQAVDPVDEGVVWASGHEGMIARTTDGGTTWRAARGPGGDTLQFRDVAAFGASTAFVLTSGDGPLSRIYRTGDGGESWTLQHLVEHPAGFLDCMDFWDRERGIAYGDALDGELYLLRTTDGGGSWRRVPGEALPPAGEGEGGFAASGTCAVTGSDGVAWIATGNGPTSRVLRTGDGGETWSVATAPVISGPLAGLTSLSFLDGRVGVGVGGSLGDDSTRTRNVARTTDGGATWEEGGRLDMVGPAYGSAVVPGRPGPVVVAVGPGGMDLSTDGGLTWASVDRRSWWAVAFASPTTGWAVGPEGRIVRLEVVDSSRDGPPP